LWSQRELYKKQRISWKSWQTTCIARHNHLSILCSGEGDIHVRRSICQSYPNSSERASTFLKTENLIPKVDMPGRLNCLAQLFYSKVRLSHW
jgi:hypothetical protein